MKTTILAYAGCSTCRKAIAWLNSHDVPFTERAIVDEPPSVSELELWVPASEVPIKKWLNTSGLSYRALGKAKVDAASEATLKAWLAADGKLVKRPVVVHGKKVLVGFNEEAYRAAFATAK